MLCLVQYLESTCHLLSPRHPSAPFLPLFALLEFSSACAMPEHDRQEGNRSRSEKSRRDKASRYQIRTRQAMRTTVNACEREDLEGKPPSEPPIPCSILLIFRTDSLL